MYQYPLDAPSVPISGLLFLEPLQHAPIANAAQGYTLPSEIRYRGTPSEGIEHRHGAHFLGKLSPVDTTFSFALEHQLTVRETDGNFGGYHKSRQPQPGIGIAAGVEHTSELWRFLYRWSICAFMDADDEVVLEPWVIDVRTRPAAASQERFLVADMSSTAPFGFGRRIHLLPNATTIQETTSSTRRAWLHGDGFFHQHTPIVPESVGWAVGLFARNNHESANKKIYHLHGHVSLAAVRGPDPLVRSEPL